MTTTTTHKPAAELAPGDTVTDERYAVGYVITDVTPTLGAFVIKTRPAPGHPAYCEFVLWPTDWIEVAA